jgi:hypothetical protein
MLGSRQYGADRLYRIQLIAEKPPLKACRPCPSCSKRHDARRKLFWHNHLLYRGKSSARLGTHHPRNSSKSPPQRRRGAESFLLKQPTVGIPGRLVFGF